MRWIYTLPLRLRSLFRKRQVEQELDEELAYHIDRKTEEYLSHGLNEDQARDAAQRAMAGLTQRKEECRDARRVGWIEDLIQDLRYGGRMFRKSPGFTALAGLILALGIGANTAIFSFVDAVLFRPPFVKDPATLVSVFTTVSNERRTASSFTDFQALQRNSQKLTDWIAHASVPLAWNGIDQSELVFGVAATENYFSSLGVAPMLGRTFGVEDAASPVVVLENRHWRERWRADPTVLGRTMRLGARSYSVVGVMPEGFRGTNATFTPAVWIPLASWSGITEEQLHEPARRWLDVSARVAPGASIQESKAEMKALSAHLDPIPERPRERRSLVAFTQREARISGDRTFAFIATILSVIVGMVLLIASSNVASLLMTRTLVRRREIAVRQSLGAARSRIVRQLLTEGLLLAAVGAAGGAILADWALKLLAAYQIPSPAPFVLDARLDARTLAFTTLVAIGTSILFGLMPALEASRTDLIGRIRPQQRRVRRSMEVLVAIQVAIGVVLVTGTSLFVAALDRAAAVNPGFDPEHAVAMTLNPSLIGYSQEQSRNFYRQLLERVRAIPGVEAAGLAQSIPLGFGITTSWLVIPGAESQSLLRARYNVIDGDFFPALGTRLIRGRSFLPTDTGASPPVMVLNESLARTFFPGKDPIGERVCISGPPVECRLVVGLAQQGKYITLAEEPAPYYWIPFSQRFLPQMTLVVRAKGEPSGYLALARREAATLQPNLPVMELKTLQDHMRIPMLEPRIPSFFLTTLSVIGLVLSMGGIFGITAYSVRSRTKEIGIRMAIGAGRLHVFRAIVERPLVVVAIAIVCGLGLSIKLGTLVSSLLYGLSPNDPVRLAAVALLMFGAMLAGCLAPAYLATKVAPAITLRED